MDPCLEAISAREFMKSPLAYPLLVGSFVTLLSTRAIEVDTSFSPHLPSGTVHSVTAGSDGSVFVGGEFNGPAVLHLTPNGVVPETRAQGGAYSLTFLGSDLFAGGSFGVSAPNWNLPANGRVLAMAASGDQLLVGGTFWSQPACFVARLNKDGTVDSGFGSALKVNFSLEAGVSALAVQSDGKVIVAGNFSTDGGFSSLARLNADGSIDTTLSRNNGPILYPKAILILSDGKILVGGVADSSGRGFVRRLNVDGTVDSSFSEPSFDSSVEALAADSSGRLIVGGEFTMANGATHERLARLNADGSVDPSWTLGANNVVKAIAVSQSSVLVGGAFTRIGDVAQNGVARLKEVSALGANPQLRLRLQAEVGRAYVIESSDDLNVWSEVRHETAAEQGLTVNTRPTEPRLFFRARLAE
jgi:uncharacterized delta-60 repeat protein